MANIEELITDLKATTAYVRGEITEKADTFDFDQLVALSDEITDVARAVREAAQLLSTEQTKQLEGGARTVGTRVFARIPKYAERWQHDVIAAGIRAKAMELACDHETGEVPAKQAVEIAVRLTQAAYVSPSTSAKVGTVRDELGLPLKEARLRENKGWDINVVETAVQDDDA